MSSEPLIPKHGGYRKMRSFQVAQVVYDVTVRFCERYVDRFSRTRDQMVQAARSGVQNIAEGSEASATSRKMELKLTQVARASLEELKLDYEDFLRQNRLACWDRRSPLRQRLVDARPGSADEVAAWIKGVAREILGSERSKGSEPSGHRGPSGAAKDMGCSARHRVGGGAPTASSGSTRFTPFTGSTQSTLSTLYAELSANAALTLATVAGYLLDRQIRALSKAFVDDGGFTERLYRVRSRERNRRTNH